MILEGKMGSGQRWGSWHKYPSIWSACFDMGCGLVQDRGHSLDPATFADMADAFIFGASEAPEQGVQQQQYQVQSTPQRCF
jgi:hypothetical protein